MIHRALKEKMLAGASLRRELSSFPRCSDALVQPYHIIHVFTFIASTFSRIGSTIILYPKLHTMTIRPNASRATTSTSNVRRNLFPHHLGRRPTSASTSTSATTLQASPEDNGQDIVIRDKNGNYQVDIPLVPAVGDEHGSDDDMKEKESTLHLSRRMLEGTLLTETRGRSALG